MLDRKYLYLERLAQTLRHSMIVWFVESGEEQR
jgi:hypothetical protein